MPFSSDPFPDARDPTVPCPRCGAPVLFTDPSRNLPSLVYPDQTICGVCSLEEHVRGETAAQHASWFVDPRTARTVDTVSPSVGLLLPRRCSPCQEWVTPSVTSEATLHCPRCAQRLDLDVVTFHRLSTPISLVGFPWATVEQVAERIALSGLLGPWVIEGATLQDTADWHFALHLAPPASTSQAALARYLRLPGFSIALAQALIQSVTQVGLHRPPVPVVPTRTRREFLWWHRLSQQGYAGVLLPLASWNITQEPFADWLAFGEWAVGLPYFRTALTFPR